MSSEACRALVALLVTLIAATILVLPVAAKTDALVESSNVTYTVHPRTGKVDVRMVFVLRTRQYDEGFYRAIRGKGGRERQVLEDIADLYGD